jgi:AraC family transcriptional regulator
MKTVIPFHHKVTGIKSNCGDPLNITVSSRNLNWDGVLVEQGSSPHFHPKDVVTPNFYFAMELEHAYNWRLEQDGDMVPFSTEPGDIWINPPNTPFTHNIDVACYFLIINISEERLLNSFDRKLPKGLKFLNNYNIQDKTLKDLMSLLLTETESGGQNGPWFVDYVIKLFSNYFIRHYSNYTDLVKEIPNSSIIGEKEIHKINIYIDKHISESITIDDLANELLISKFHFLNEFKKTTGYTPYQHIQNTRIDAAKKLLLDKDMKILAIAHRLGFSDNSHFSRSFKKATGISPKAYRESH